MNPQEIIIYSVVGIAAIFAASWAGAHFSRKVHRARNFEHINTAAQEKKDAAKHAVLSFALERGRVANNDVEKLAGVSDATATRYLEELVAEGKIDKKGDGGRGTYYELKK
jgi:Fic family protein